MGAVLTATVACSDPVGPGRMVQPQLRTLSLSLLAPNLYPHGGLLNVDARTADTSFRLQRDQRVPAEVSASSGDRETARLFLRSCPARDRGLGYPCFRFQIGMKQGHQAAEVADHVAAIGGRFYLLSPSFGGVTVFYPEVVETARRAAQWPGVDHTALMGYGGGCPMGCSIPLGTHLFVPMPVDVGEAIPGDGIVQVQPGDLLTVTYQQPGGGTVRATASVP